MSSFSANTRNWRRLHHLSIGLSIRVDDASFQAVSITDQTLLQFRSSTFFTSIC